MKNMDVLKPKKISIKQRISLKFHKIITKIKEKYEKSNELKSIASMVLEITITGVLLALGYLAFTTESIIFKILGFGSLFWLIKTKVVVMISQILGSIKLVSMNR